MKISEKIVIKNENSLTVRYISLKGSNVNIGKQLGEISKANHNINLESFKSTSREHTKNTKEYFEKNYPIHYQRMCGITEAFDADIENTDYDFSSLSYNFNLPTQIGCSSIFVPPILSENKEAILSRNYDFPLTTLADLLNIPLSDEQKEIVKPMMSEPYIIELQPEDGGYHSLSLTSFDLLGGVLDGINSKGLAICVNGDEIATGQHFKEGLQFGKEGLGLNELQSMRLILDSCANVNEAKEMLKKHQHYFSFLPCHYLITDRQGKSLIFEYDYQKQIPFFIEENDKIQLMTNHPVHTFPTVKAFPNKNSFLEAGTSSFQRYATLAKYFETLPPPYTEEKIKAICNSVSVSKIIDSIPKDYQMQILSQPGLSLTLWHCIYNCNRKNLAVKFLTNKKITDDGTYSEEYSDYFTFDLGEK